MARQKLSGKTTPLPIGSINPAERPTTSGQLPYFATSPRASSVSSCSPATRCGPPSSCPRAADSLRQATLVQAQRKFIARRRRKTGQTTVQLQHKRGRRQCPHLNRWVPALQPPERIPADKQPPCHVGSRDPALPPGQGQVTAQFAQRVRGGQWHVGCRRHGCSVRYGRHYVK